MNGDDPHGPGVYLHVLEPHAPYLPPPPFFGRFHDPAYKGGVLSRYVLYSRFSPGTAFRELPNFLSAFPSLTESDLGFLVRGSSGILPPGFNRLGSSSFGTGNHVS